MLLVRRFKFDAFVDTGMRQSVKMVISLLLMVVMMQMVLLETIQRALRSR